MLSALLFAVTSSVAMGSPDDDTLRFYLSKSSLVVSGEIVDEPVATVSELGVYRWAFRLRVSEIVKGKTHDEELNIRMSRYQFNNTENPAFLSKGGNVVLFLRRETNRPEYRSWREADGWFGVQQFNSVLVEGLKRVVEEE